MPSGSRGQPGKGLPEEAPARTAAPLQTEVFFTRSRSLVKQIIGGHRMTHSLRALSHLPALPSRQTPTWRLAVPLVRAGSGERLGWAGRGVRWSLSFYELERIICTERCTSPCQVWEAPGKLPGSQGSPGSTHHPTVTAEKQGNTGFGSLAARNSSPMSRWLCLLQPQFPVSGNQV